MTLSIGTLAREHRALIERKLSNLARQLQPSVQADEENVRRAAFAVRNKSVKFTRYNAKTLHIYATVHDVVTTDVSMSFQTGEIQCSCPQTNCRHELAVLLSLYQYSHSVSEWITTWRAKKNEQLQLLKLERSPSSWKQMADYVMQQAIPSKGKVDFHALPTVFDQTIQTLWKSMPIEREWQSVFKAFMMIEVTTAIWIYMNDHYPTIENDFFGYHMQKQTSVFGQIVEELPQKPLFAIEPFYEAIQVRLRELVLHCKGFPLLRGVFYITSYDNIFSDAKWASKELQALEQEYSDGDLSIAFCRSVQYTKLADERLSATIDECMFDFLSLQNLAFFALNIGQTASLQMILRKLAPLVGPQMKRIPAPFRSQLAAQMLQLYDAAEMEEHEKFALYSTLGSYGVQHYANYLLKQKKYEEWIALQQLFPSSIDFLKTIGLNDVIENCPNVALPLFHQYAVEEINQKSRTSYKQAVRIWRSMKTVAKKANKLDYFEDYIQTMKQQYKRLRALQEELEKSHLLLKK